LELKSLMIGDEVTKVRSLLELSYPMEEGIIKNKEDMELLWDYVLTKKLKLVKSDLKDRKILMTEAPSNPTKNKIDMAQILFEKIGIGYFNIEPQAKMTIFCEGEETGVVLDSGDGVTHVIPIAHNYLLHHQIKRLDIAGRHITNYLIKLLQIKGYAFNSTADFEIVRELKEKYCFVSCDIDSDRKLGQETTFYNSYTKLPDGRKIRISTEKYEAPEILFQPHLIQNEMPGVHEMLYNSINSCDIDVRKDLYKNIILSGASTMFPGYASRLDKELKNIYTEKTLKLAKDKTIKIPLNIIDSPRRKYSVFIGATVLANVYNAQGYEGYWISKSEWEESGEKIIKAKCKNIIN